jgi:poly(A) polymerase
VKLPEAPWQRRSRLGKLLDVLQAETGATRYVGGCVRDTLLGLEVADVDLATRLAPEEVMRRLRSAGIKAVPTGLAHGTVTAVIAGAPIEITTLRRDVSTDGRRATVAYTGEWREDAARRDFTMNALSADPGTRELFDFFGGLSDLEARLVRFIGDPLTRIAEDHLRILRFFRFHARFGAGAPDTDAIAACTARANDLMALSRERIADELLKLLGLPDPSPTAALMHRLGIFAPILPELSSEGIGRLEQLIKRERTVGVDPDPMRRFAALLPTDPDIAGSIAARLRLSKRASKRLVAAAERTEKELRSPEQIAYWLGAEEAADRIMLGTGDPATVRDLEGWNRPRLPISGGDLIALGLPAGPAVATTLRAIEREWAEGGFAAGRDQVRALARVRVDQVLRSIQ